MRLALAAFTLLTGCVASPADEQDPVDPTADTDPDTDPDPDPAPTPAVATGTYQVRSQLDLTIEALLPAQLHELVVTLRDFSTNPARTLFDTAEDAGVPAVSELRAALPDALESRLEGWIDDEIARLTVDGVPVTQLAGDLAGLAERSLSRFALDSELAIAGSQATHRLTTLDLTPAGLDAQFPLGALPGSIVSATATCTPGDGTLALGAHGYAIPYGDYVWQALEARSVATRGTDLRGTLGVAVNCPVLAATVASKCVFGVCVGHAAELTEICEAGLDEIVDRVHDKFSALRIDALHFQHGAATLVDADVDGAAERMDGVWTAQLNAGMGLRNAPATFTATK